MFGLSFFQGTICADESNADNAEHRAKAEAQFDVGMEHNQNGRSEEAAKAMLLAAEMLPQSAFIARIADQLIQWQMPDLALRVIDQAQSREIVSANLSLQKGIAFKLIGKSQEAFEAFSAALLMAPQNAEARKELVLAHLRKNEIDAALGLIREGSAFANLSVEKRIGLIGLYLQTILLAPSRRSSLEKELTLLLEQTEKDAVSSPEHQMILAEGFAMIGKHEIAIELLQSILKTAPSTPLAREKLVELYLREGLSEKAMDELNRLLVENPKNPSAHYLLGSIAADRDEYETARDHYEEAIAIRPELQAPYYDLVRLHLNARRPRAALRTLDRARALFPKGFLGEFYSGIALASLRHASEALTHFIEAESIATRQSPEYLTPFFYFQIGAMHERNGNYEEAQSKFLKGLAEQPEDAETLNYLGYMWAERGERLDQASEWIEKAIALAPENAAIQDSMGWVLFRQGHPDQALPFLLRAKAGLKMPDPVVLDHLGDVYEALGNHEKALKFWEDSLEIEFNERILKKLPSSIHTP